LPQVVECFRRLALASAIGIVNADSAVSPIMGILICQVFVHIFSIWAPYKTDSDNSLGIVLAYSLVLMFLAALLIKVDVTSDDSSDQALFGAFLVMILMAGPIAIVYQLTSSKLFVALTMARKFLLPKKKKKKETRKSAAEVELAFRAKNKAEEGIVSDGIIIQDGKAVAMATECLSCGNTFKGDSKFCRQCGTKRLTAAEADLAASAPRVLSTSTSVVAASDLSLPPYSASSLRSSKSKNSASKSIESL